MQTDTDRVKLSPSMDENTPEEEASCTASNHSNQCEYLEMQEALEREMEELSTVSRQTTREKSTSNIKKMEENDVDSPKTTKTTYDNNSPIENNNDDNVDSNNNSRMAEDEIIRAEINKGNIVDGQWNLPLDELIELKRDMIRLDELLE